MNRYLPAGWISLVRLALCAAGLALPVRLQAAITALPPSSLTPGAAPRDAPLALSGSGFTNLTSATFTRTGVVSNGIAWNPGNRPVTIHPNALPTGTVGVSYRATLSASGGTPPYSWSVVGNLPPGLSLQQQFVILPVPGPVPDWAIGGTPTTAGTYTFTVQVRDSAGQTARRGFSITVRPAEGHPGHISGELRAADLIYGTLHLDGLVTPPVLREHALRPGSAEARAALEAAVGQRVVVRGAYLHEERVFVVSTVVTRPTRTPLTIITTSLPPGTVGTAYNASLQASGGRTPYRWSVVRGGRLPPGLRLQRQQFVILPVPGPSPGWAIVGTPTTAGTYTFTVQVRDSAGRTAQRELSITVQAGDS